MMQIMYEIAFFCLLRFEKILRIQYHYIKVFNKKNKNKNYF